MKPLRIIEQLGTLMAGIANDRDKLRKLVEAAKADGFEFDD